MKLERVDGCLASSLNVDGVEEIDMTDEQRLNVIEHICSWMRKHPEQLNYILQDMIDSFGEETDCTDKPCECCGDYIYTTTWVID